jgi:hypothetical protein
MILIVDHRRRKQEPKLAWYAIQLRTKKVELRGGAIKDPTYHDSQWVQWWVPISQVERLIERLRDKDVAAIETCEANKLTEAEMKKKIKSWKSKGKQS